MTDFRMSNVTVCARDWIHLLNDGGAIHVVDLTRTQIIALTHVEDFDILGIAVGPSNTMRAKTAVLWQGRTVPIGHRKLPRDACGVWVKNADCRVVCGLGRDNRTRHEATVNHSSEPALFITMRICTVRVL